MQSATFNNLSKRLSNTLQYETYCPLLHLITIMTRFQSSKMDCLHSKIQDQFKKLQQFNFNNIQHSSLDVFLQTYPNHLKRSQNGIKLLKLLVTRLNRNLYPQKLIFIYELLADQYHHQGQIQQQCKILFQAFNIGLTLKQKIYKSLYFGLKSLELMENQSFQKYSNSVIVSIKNQIQYNQNNLLKNISLASSVYGNKLKSSNKSNKKNNKQNKNDHQHHSKVYNISTVKHRNLSLYRSSEQNQRLSFKQGSLAFRQSNNFKNFTPFTHSTPSDEFKQKQKRSPYLVMQKKTSKLRNNKTIHHSTNPNDLINRIKNKVKTKSQLLPYNLLLYELYSICVLRFKSQIKKKYYKDFKNQIKQKIIREYPGRNIEQVLFDIELEKIKSHQQRNESQWMENSLSPSKLLKKRKIDVRLRDKNQTLLGNMQIAESLQNSVMMKSQQIPTPYKQSTKKNRQTPTNNKKVDQNKTNCSKLEPVQNNFMRLNQNNNSCISQSISHSQVVQQQKIKICQDLDIQISQSFCQQSKQKQKQSLKVEIQKNKSGQNIRTRKLSSRSLDKNKIKINKDLLRNSQEKSIQKTTHNNDNNNQTKIQVSIRKQQIPVSLSQKLKQKIGNKNTLKKKAKNLIQQKKFIKHLAGGDRQNQKHQEYKQKIAVSDYLKQIQKQINDNPSQQKKQIRQINDKKIVKNSLNGIQKHLLQDLHVVNNNAEQKTNNKQDFIEQRDKNDKFVEQKQTDNKQIQQSQSQEQDDSQDIDLDSLAYEYLDKQIYQKVIQQLNQQTNLKLLKINDNDNIQKIGSNYNEITDQNNQNNYNNEQSDEQKEVNKQQQVKAIILIKQQQRRQQQTQQQQQQSQKTPQINNDNEQSQNNNNMSIMSSSSHNNRSTNKSIFSKQKIMRSLKHNQSQEERQGQGENIEKQDFTEQINNQQQQKLISIPSINELKQTNEENNNQNDKQLDQSKQQSAIQQQKTQQKQQLSVSANQTQYISEQKQAIIEFIPINNYQEIQLYNNEVSHSADKQLSQEQHQTQLQCQDLSTKSISSSNTFSQYSQQNKQYLMSLYQTQIINHQNTNQSDNQSSLSQPSSNYEESYQEQRCQKYMKIQMTQQQNQQQTSENNQNQLYQTSNQQYSVLLNEYMTILQQNIIQYAEGLQIEEHKSTSFIKENQSKPQNQEINHSQNDKLLNAEENQLKNSTTTEIKQTIQKQHSTQEQKPTFISVHEKQCFNHPQKQQQQQAIIQQAHQINPIRTAIQRSSIQDSLTGMADLVRGSLINSNSNNLLSSNMNISTLKSIIKSDSRIKIKNETNNKQKQVNNSAQKVRQSLEGGGVKLSNNENKSQQQSSLTSPNNQKLKSVKISTMVARQQTISSQNQTYSLVINQHLLKPQLKVNQSKVVLSVFHPYQRKSHQIQKQFNQTVKVKDYLKGLQVRLIRNLNQFLLKSTKTQQYINITKGTKQNKNAIRRNSHEQPQNTINQMINWNYVIQNLKDINLQPQLFNLKTLKIQFKKQQFLTVNLMHYLDYNRMILQYKKNPLDLKPIQISIDLNQTEQQIKSLFNQRNVKIEITSINNLIQPILQVYNIWCHIQTLAISLKNSISKLKSLFKLHQFVYRSQEDDQIKFNIVIQMIQNQDQKQNLVISDVDQQSRNKIVNNFSVIIGYAVKIAKGKSKFTANGKEIKQFLQAI